MPKLFIAICPICLRRMIKSEANEICIRCEEKIKQEDKMTIFTPLEIVQLENRVFLPIESGDKYLVQIIYLGESHIEAFDSLLSAAQFYSKMCVLVYAHNKPVFK